MRTDEISSNGTVIFSACSMTSCSRCTLSRAGFAKKIFRYSISTLLRKCHPFFGEIYFLIVS